MKFPRQCGCRFPLRERSIKPSRSVLSLQPNMTIRKGKLAVERGVQFDALVKQETMGLAEIREISGQPVDRLDDKLAEVAGRASSAKLQSRPTDTVLSDRFLSM